MMPPTPPPTPTPPAGTPHAVLTVGAIADVTDTDPVGRPLAPDRLLPLPCRLTLRPRHIPGVPGAEPVAVEVTLTPDLIGLAIQYPDGRFLRLALLPTTLPAHRTPPEAEPEGEPDGAPPDRPDPPDPDGRR
jgi:hypothetical protein